MNRLFVILGAGASKDCSTPSMLRDGGPVPPLVKELFDPQYMEILGRYPTAQAAGADIRKAGRDAAVLEQFIRERYRDSTHRPDRRKYVAIPCYLQDLLHAVSTTYTRQPDNYDLLITALTRLPDVVLVTLNYDTLLDDRLHATVDPIDSLDAYVDARRNWSLVKLHGSVNWGRSIRSEPASLNDPDPDIEVEGEIVWRGGFGAPLEALRFDRGGQSRPLYYPALAVPVGEEDELVCPPRHVRFLKEKLATTDAAHLLVIGYSGNDKEVLRLFQDCETPVRSLYVVNQDSDAAQGVAAHLGTSLGIGLRENSWSEVPFGEFVQSNEIDRYLGELAL